MFWPVSCYLTEPGFLGGNVHVFVVFVALPCRIGIVESSGVQVVPVTHKRIKQNFSRED